MPREQYEIHWKDYYQLLGVQHDASPGTIHRMWRRLSQVYHPDVAGDTAVDPERMRDLNEAHEVLSDSERRARYDQFYQTRKNGSDSDYSNSSWNEESSYTRNDYENEDWYSYGGTTQDSGYSDSYAHQSSPRQASYEYEQVPVLSIAFLRLLLDRLLDKICPNPDESQKIMPWPSWSLQRLFLMGSIPLSILLLIVALANGAWVVIVFAILLSAASVYAGVITQWLRTTGEAPLPARIAGGTSITISGISMTLAVGYMVFMIVISILMLIFIGAMARAMLAEAFRKYLR